MNEDSQRALLPAGLGDKLPPDAEAEARATEALVACFAAHGYRRVSPPLVEFEDNLLSAAGADMADRTFRIMDPVSQRMMGLRADMTMQVARIAATRLHRAPRPLRLCYAGDVLRVRGTQLRPERQFAQVGVELIGPAPEAADMRADIEIVALAAEGLAALGIADVTADLGSPSLLRRVLADFAGDCAALHDAIDHKDTARVASLAGDMAPVLTALLDVVGPAGPALEKLAAIDLPAGARADADRLAEVARGVAARLPDLGLTVDPVENRGFEYHTALSLTLFAPGVRGELGRGGRYLAAGDEASGEPGTGFTLFMDSVMRALPDSRPGETIFLPPEMPPETAAGLRAAGWITLAGLEDDVDVTAEARRLGCTHIYRDGKPVPVGGE